MQRCHIVVIIPPHIYTEILIEIRQKLWANIYTNICQPLPADCLPPEFPSSSAFDILNFIYFSLAG